jgi:hypothetical protein
MTRAPSAAQRSSSASGLAGPLTVMRAPSTPTTSRASAYSAAHTTSAPASSSAKARRKAVVRLVL